MNKLSILGGAIGGAIIMGFYILALQSNLLPEINWNEYETGKNVAYQELSVKFQQDLDKMKTEFQAQYDEEIKKLKNNPVEEVKE